MGQHGLQPQPGHYGNPAIHQNYQQGQFSLASPVAQPNQVAQQSYQQSAFQNSIAVPSAHRYQPNSYNNQPATTPSPQGNIHSQQNFQPGYQTTPSPQANQLNYVSSQYPHSNTESAQHNFQYNHPVSRSAQSNLYHSPNRPAAPQPYNYRTGATTESVPFQPSPEVQMSSMAEIGVVASQNQSPVNNISPVHAQPSFSAGQNLASVNHRVPNLYNI